jgi:DnaJ-class molecular chaperone
MKWQQWQREMQGNGGSGKFSGNDSSGKCSGNGCNRKHSSISCRCGRVYIHEVPTAAAGDAVVMAAAAGHPGMLLLII